MAWNFAPDRPIYLQIAERVASDIAGGRYRPGDKFMTVRDLALTAGVNPNTVQRAMTELEADGLLESRRGDGRYIAENSVTSGAARERLTEEKTATYVQAMQALGHDAPAIHGAIDTYLKGETRQ